jgi:hypothetical protein
MGVGQPAHPPRFEGKVREVFAIQMVPGIRYPELIIEDGEVLANSFALPEESLATGNQ